MDFKDKMEIGVRANKLLNKFFEENHFEDVIEGNITPEVFFEEVEIPDRIRYAFGASRIVFWDDYDPDYVYKFNLGRDFDGTKSIDYTMNECKAYAAAERKGIASAFAWCDIVGYWHDRPIVAMEYCDTGDCVSDYSYGIYMKNCAEDAGYDIDNMNEDEWQEVYNSYDFDGDDSAMREVALTTWGKDFFYLVEDFLDEACINDLHEGNWGLNYAGELVITDYAGFGHNLDC